MQTISNFLREEREMKRISLPELEEKTKIKKVFLVAIENANWDILPEYPVVSGFVRSIADALEADTKKASALLRRDYPPKVVKINPKPDIGKTKSFGPKNFFLIGITFLIFGVFVYLFLSYRNFTKPPMLDVYSPTDGQEVEGVIVKVQGKTTPDSTVLVNNQPLYILEDGSFTEELEISSTTSELVFKAVSRAEKETIVVRKIKLIAK